MGVVVVASVPMPLGGLVLLLLNGTPVLGFRVVVELLDADLAVLVGSSLVFSVAMFTLPALVVLVSISFVGICGRGLLVMDSLLGLDDIRLSFSSVGVMLIVDTPVGLCGTATGCFCVAVVTVVDTLMVLSDS